MSINHRRIQVFMSKQFLECTHIIACLQQVCGKRMAQGMAPNMLDDTSLAYCFFEGSLQRALTGMIPLSNTRVAINGNCNASLESQPVLGPAASAAACEGC